MPKTEEARMAGKRAERVKADSNVPDFAKDKMMDMANEKAMEGYQERKRKGMKTGGKVSSCGAKKMMAGGSVRGCGAAKRGVKKAKMY